MPYRRTPLIKTEIYHIFTRSIAGFKIFNSDKDYRRMVEVIDFYTAENPPCKFSLFWKLKEKSEKNKLLQNDHSKKIVRIFAYCLMPTHIHLILRPLKDSGISRYVNLILKSYTKYFNVKHNRKGPLWEGRFKSVLVKTDEQFLHLTRYIHLNPVSSYLINNPEDWVFSSYKEYIGLNKNIKGICDFSDVLDINTDSYEKFVNDQIDYQRELAQIKNLVIE